MKLVENPVKVSVSLRKMIPRTVTYLYGKKTIKYFRTYTLGSTNVYYIDAFSHIDVILENTHRKIGEDQVDFVIDQLLKTPKDDLKIDHLLKDEIEQANHRHLKMKDIVLIQKQVSE